jgi:signal transduction histidine kinase
VLPEAGPKEVRELIGAFNAMLDRVAASQRSQREFVSNVSHELKTPLTSIQGFAQAIKDGTANSPEERLQAAEIIHAEAGRMHRLAVDLLILRRSTRARWTSSALATFMRSASWCRIQPIATVG